MGLLKCYTCNTVIKIIIIQLICNKSAESYYNFTIIYSVLLNNTGPTSSALANTIWKRYNTLNNKECKNDIERYIDGVHNQELWALKMLDSSTHLQSGFLEGNIINFGNYEECLNINYESNNNSSRNIKGSLCRVTFEPPYDPEETYKYYHRTSIVMGICLPTSCTRNDVHKMLAKELNFESSYKLIYCTDLDQSKTKLNAIQSFIILIFIILTLFLITGTVYDIITNEFNKKKGTIFKILLSFSARNNLKNLFKKDKNVKSIKSVHGLRFISACVVLTIHRILRDSQSFTNLFTMDDEVRKWYHLIVTNGYIFVDAFFLMSGLLVSYSFINRYKSIGIKLFDYLKLLLHRYIRLTPPVVIIMMLTLSSNILCRGYNCDRMEGEKANCEEFWYINVIYISNFYDPFDQCIPHGWYLSADMQMFLFSPLLLYIATTKPKHVLYGILFSLMIVNIMTTFTISFNNKIIASNIGPFELLREKTNKTYTPFYTRAGPWLIGFLLGLILQQHSKQPIIMKKEAVIRGWTIATICCLVSLFGMYPFIQHDHNYNPVLEPLYESLHRILWAIGIAWIIFACHIGHGGVVNTVLSCETFHPLSKLSYSFYLIHPFIQQLQIGYTYTSRKFTDISQIPILLGDIFYSTICSILLYLAVEAPTQNLQNIFDKKKGPERELNRFNSSKTEVIVVD
ncbi:nose resistant to fluoxetine protein 6-like [Lycorma delicatula]|uniref:nose resistant to fluoxetine protein 6-like n=1 Tax=Lycorma delicatula TaxID=130591 RepID=UPI003F510BC0